METKYIEDNLGINSNQILSIIKTGGTKYDTTNEHKDIDYFVIVDIDLKFKRIYDKSNKNDYLCFGLEFVKELINDNDKEHFNKPYVLLDLCNQEEHLIYGNKIIDYDLFTNIDNIKNYYVKWLTKDYNAILKNLMVSKNIFYAFVLMYYYKNGCYSLTEKQQEIVNHIHKKKPVDEIYLDEFVDFFGTNNTFSKELKILNKIYFKKQQKVEKLWKM